MGNAIMWIWSFAIELFVFTVGLGFAIFAGFCLLTVLSFAIVPVCCLFFGEDTQNKK